MGVGVDKAGGRGTAQTFPVPGKHHVAGRRDYYP